jgi:hypothetical protein
MTTDAAVIDHDGAKVSMEAVHWSVALAVEQVVDAGLGAVEGFSTSWMIVLNLFTCMACEPTRHCRWCNEISIGQALH